MTFAQILPEFLRTRKPITREVARKQWFIKYSHEKGYVLCEWLTATEFTEFSSSLPMKHLDAVDWIFLN